MMMQQRKLSVCLGRFKIVLLLSLRDGNTYTPFLRTSVRKLLLIVISFTLVLRRDIYLLISKNEIKLQVHRLRLRDKTCRGQLI